MRLTTLAAALVAVTLMSACADMSGVAGSEAKLRDAASVGLTNAGANADTNQTVRTDWWVDFGDTNLTALINQALADAPSLKMAKARLAKAEAVADVSHSALMPTLGLDVEGTRQLFTQNSIYPPPLGGNIYNVGTAQLEAGWEIDFFGKNHDALSAALGAARAAQADAEAARILLATNVARTWFQLGRINAQLDVAKRSLAQRQEMLGLVKDRVSAGLDTKVELRQSEGGIPDARLQIEILEEQAQISRHALAALIGTPAQADAIKAPVLSTLRAQSLANVIPLNLLGLRPDIAAARFRVEAATGDVGSAKSLFYPNVNLTAFAGFSSIGFGRLHEASSTQWGIGPAIRLPIFEGGKLRANLRVKNADLDTAIESYNATLIDAVRDVADQVASNQSISRQRMQQELSQKATEDAYDLAMQRYKAGIGNYLQVLATETAVLNQRRQAIDLLARSFDTQVALIRALGGGYTANQNSLK